ncbi:MBL fold metallo-hydrolase [Vibrio lamellibrachiae]|uniref:alkyl sulfatase dimerization domain-containing protein n=1 Tax=Vibrio lamellibrachiae TaxID=2910253 RepID=UPI003D0E868C
MFRKSVITAAIVLFPLSVTASAIPDLETRTYHDVELSAGNNPYQVKRYAPEYFVNHADHFEEALYQHPSAPIWTIVAENAFASIHVIDAPEGLIIIDTGLNESQMKPVAEKIKQLSDKPIKAVVYTHAHADHTGGVGAFITPEQVENGDVEVIADSTFLDAFVSENSATGPLMFQRAMMMYGAVLQPEDRDQFTTGCCGHLTTGPTSFIAPTRTIEGEETITVAGLEMTFSYSGGENSGHMIAYVPQYKTIFTGDELQGPAAPQLHSPRGTKFRDTDAWINAIDTIRAYEPEHMLPGHGVPEYGKDKVDNILVTYRDAMQYQHDQAIRLINQGKGPDDLANEIEIPDYLTLDPFTIQTYGNVKTNVRSYYTGYVSWWDGNPANLDPLPKVDEAQKLIEAMGGRERVVALAEQALENGEIKWSVTLSDKLVRVDQSDVQARQLKAAGLRNLGYASINSSNRGFYLAGADELDGVLNMQLVNQLAKGMLANPNMIAGFSTPTLLEGLRYKVLPEAVGGVETKYQINFTDTGETFTVILRNGIVEIVDGEQGNDVTVTTTRPQFDQLFTGAETELSNVAKVKGNKSDIQKFGKAFDFNVYPISIAVQ